MWGELRQFGGFRGDVWEEGEGSYRDEGCENESKYIMSIKVYSESCRDSLLCKSKSRRKSKDVRGMWEVS